MAEVIEEIAGLNTNNNNLVNEEIVMEPYESEFVEKSNQRSWFEQVDSSRLHASHVSHQRNGRSNVNPSITLPEVIPREIPDLDVNLPDPTNEEAIELGLYTIDQIGRQVYEKINAPKFTRTPLMKLKAPTPIQTSANLMMSPEVSVGLNLEQSVEPPIVQTPIEFEPITPVPQQDPQIQSESQPQVNSSQRQTRQTRANDQVVPDELQSQENARSSGRLQELRERGNLQFEETNSNMTLQRQILETVRQELVADDQIHQQPQKKKRVRRARKRSVSPSNRAPTQQMHKSLIFHQKKTRDTARPHYQLTIHFQEDIFEGLDDYIAFERDYETIDGDAIRAMLSFGEEEMMQDVEVPVQQKIGEFDVEMPEIFPQNVTMPPPELPAPEIETVQNVPQRGSIIPELPEFIPQMASSTPRPSLVSDLPVPKLNLRPSTIRENTRNSLIVPSENITPQPELMQIDQISNVPEIVPVMKDIPVPTADSVKPRTSQISAKDIEFAKFSHISKRRLNESPHRMPCDVVPRRRLRAHFRESSGKSEKLITLVGHDSTETYSKYCMEVSWKLILF